MAACILCGRSVRRSRPGRRRLYCSNACRQRAYRYREVERVWRGSDPDLETDIDVTTLLNEALALQGRR